MKRILFFVLMVLVLAVSSCNLFLKEEYGELILSFDGTLPDGSRALDSNGLPILSSSPMKIDIIREDGSTVTRELGAEEPKSLVELVPVGERIEIKVSVSTELAEWKGSEEHTVTPGTNRVAVRLSKAAKSAGNIFIDVDSTGHVGTLKTSSGKQLLSGVVIDNNDKKYPVMARDRIGRVYVLYNDTSTSHKHLKRFNVEGEEDTRFEGSISHALPSSVSINNIDTIAIDTHDNYIFLFKEKDVFCLKEKEGGSFEFFESAEFPSGTTYLKVTAAAAYDDVLFAVDGQTLYACKFEFEGHPGYEHLAFEPHASSNQLDKLRTEHEFDNNLTDCTGLFADDSGVYCLLKEQELRYGSLYALGQLIRYTYSGSTLAEVTKVGLNPAASTTDPLAFDARYFSNPIGFIGYNEDYVYIADDGINIGYINENWRITGNKNRIAAFSRRSGGLSFSDTDATWYAEHPEYKKPNTKVLLWEKNSHGMSYWTSTDGTDGCTTMNELFVDSTSGDPTDVFCYDQDGNLYILWKDGLNYKVRRFILQDDDFYKEGDTDLQTTNTISAIAVDVSDGNNYLYYWNDTAKQMKRYSWGSEFHNGSSENYPITISAGKLTALAANKDGVFVATKEQSLPTNPYTLRIRKYNKDTGAEDGSSVVIVEDEEAQSSHVANAPYNTYDETVHDLQIVDGVLYAVTSRITKRMEHTGSSYEPDEFRSDGILYKVGQTANTFEGSYDKKFIKKSIDPPHGAPPGTGYGFYRFIAVKPKELVIASDSAWGENGTTSSPKVENTDRIVEFNLTDMVFGNDKKSGGTFSKTLNNSGFEWK